MTYGALILAPLVLFALAFTNDSLGFAMFIFAAFAALCCSIIVATMAGSSREPGEGSRIGLGFLVFVGLLVFYTASFGVGCGIALRGLH